MNVTPNYTNSGVWQISSSLRTAHFATAEGKATAGSAAGRDEVSISQEGRDRLEVLADKFEYQISRMTKEEFMEMAEQWKSEHKLEIEANPYREVDPDGSIARKAYWESYFGQLQEAEDTIRAYYAGAYQEAVSAPIDSLMFISGKYLRGWSPYYDASIPAKERQWTHDQLHAMLTGAHVALGDPYALASCGGPKKVWEMEEIARKAAKEKLDELLGNVRK